MGDRVAEEAEAIAACHGKPVMGWVVVGHRPLTLCGLDEQRVLLYSDVATVFGSYKMALAAVERTLAYATDRGLTWGDRKDFRILPVGPVVEGG